MIVGILNGYYRTGTTFFQRLVHENNPDVADLHEPTSPLIVKQLEEEGIHAYSELHGWEIYRGYGMLEKNILDDFAQVHEKVMKKKENNCGIILNERDAVRLLEPFAESDRKVFIKSNQLHFCLSEIADEFDVFPVTITRDIAETIFSHFPKAYRNDTEWLRDAVRKNYLNNRFFCETIFEVMKEKGLAITDGKTIIEKLVSNIVVCQCEATMQSIATGRHEYPTSIAMAIRNLHRLKIPMRFSNKEYHLKVRQAPVWFANLVYETLYRSIEDRDIRILVSSVFAKFTER